MQVGNDNRGQTALSDTGASKLKIAEAYRGLQISNHFTTFNLGCTG